MSILKHQSEKMKIRNILNQENTGKKQYFVKKTSEIKQKKILKINF